MKNFKVMIRSLSSSYIYDVKSNDVNEVLNNISIDLKQQLDNNLPFLKVETELVNIDLIEKIMVLDEEAVANRRPLVDVIEETIKLKEEEFDERS